MFSTQCRGCGHKVEPFQKKCEVCGSIYPAIKEDAVIILLIVTIILLILGIYVLFYFP